MTVPMNRANPFFERDATGWQWVDVGGGRAMVEYSLTDNTNRRVGFDKAAGKPQDTVYQDPAKRIPPQAHY